MLSIISENQLNSTFAITSANDVKSICKPLLSANITEFCYLRLLKNGTHQILHTNQEWLKCAYLKLNSGAEHHQNPKDYQSGYELWSTLPNQTNITIAREQFNVAHGIALIKPSNEECELFHFATHRDNSNIINFYLNNLDFLESFAHYFKDHGQALIKKSESDQNILPRWLDNNLESIKQRKFINYSQMDTRESLYRLKRYPINLGKDEYITNTELKCLNLLANGLSTKQIAKTLNVSPRTIETHFEQLRTRLKCHSRSQVLALVIQKLPYYFSN